MAARFLSSSDSSSSGGPAAKRSKRQVSLSTFEKWQKQFDREYQTSLWLRCTKDPTDKASVSTLFCGICQQQERKIESMRNYSAAWVRGSLNQKQATSWTTPEVNNIQLPSIITGLPQQRLVINLYKAMPP